MESVSVKASPPLSQGIRPVPLPIPAQEPAASTPTSTPGPVPAAVVAPVNNNNSDNDNTAIITTTTTAADEQTNRSGTPVAESAETGDSAESLDPLSHLTHIFDKIRKQVIEWGEDANWKIDVFLLPNEDGAPTPGLPPHDPQLLSQGPATPARVPVPPSRIDLTGSPPRFSGGAQDMDVGRPSGPGSRGFALQPPPTDLPLSKSLGVSGSLNEQDIKRMSEAEAKRMLALATRQIREQQESLAQAILDLESMQRLSAKRIKDVQYQLETGKRLIKERSEERRKRIDDQGSVPPRSSSGRLETSSDPASGTPGRSDPVPPYHQHRHRHVHRHRHSHIHRHLRGKASATIPTGTDSLENLALLATQVLSREPLPVPKASQDAEGERKKRQIDDRDRGLQLRPVKRPELNGYQKDGSGSQSQALECHPSRVDFAKPSTVSNGKLKAQDQHQQLSLQPPASLMRAPSQQSTSSSSARPFAQQQLPQQLPHGSDRSLNKQRR
ncbi:hypothetical protein BG015_003803 [Linnemannia schmuckeri]|uniref:Uncharacterized protein n=1 Tax=Linnemannia schmuckeri TaxID=64567 RepID=A0A9P5VD10_9FUNG|nr:hypothetical protein BG015_003803 [Linnemannia schmuckeri]